MKQIKITGLLMWAVLLLSCTSQTDLALVAAEKSSDLKTVTAEPKKKHKASPTGVLSVDIVNDNNRLHLLTGKQKQDEKTLWYQYSDDGGVSWSDESQVLKHQEIAIKMMRGGDAQIAVQGNNIVVTWTKFDTAMPFNAGIMQAARSSDAGKTWQYIETPPDWKPGPHRYIDMAADKDAIHVVWLDRRDGNGPIKASQGLRYAHSTDAGLSWHSNSTLDKLSCSCCWNTIKADQQGNAFVLYRDKQPSDLSIGVIDNQQQWQRLNHVGAFNWQFEGCPHIAGGFDFQTTNSKKRMHAVVGTGHPDHLGVFYLYSDDAGKNWSKEKPFGDESAIHSDIASHDNGQVVAVWDMMIADGLAIFASQSTDRGQSWSEAKKLSANGLRSTHPRIVKTKTGFLVLWTASDGHQQTLSLHVINSAV